MKKNDLKKMSDEELNKAISNQEDFLGDESSSTSKKDFILLEWLYQERADRRKN